ncbi:hypothetical protein PybrP1_008495 [[Pythium] brassicae (nom. inval.)]|nr:hypothetical protein PybrP1_008495 [[Pythium] brassicae (nom. inval.)]
MLFPQATTKFTGADADGDAEPEQQRFVDGLIKQRRSPWRFVVFRTPEAIQRLHEFDANLQRKYGKKLQANAGVSYVTAICMKRQVSEKIP